MIPDPYVITDNLEQLLHVLPRGLQEKIQPEDCPALLEIVLDLGRRPEARFVDRYAYLSEDPVTREDLDSVESRLGAFGNDNRAGIPATLHRISAMRNRRGTIVGLTLRVGRAVTGIVDILRDIIETGESILLMGLPGLGKTTLLREIARVLADEMGKRVVIVDTSNEIAGDGDVPHPAIGRARRMQVARVEQQHDVMIEAVENHMPEVVVIDEIGRTEETLAARTIAERGVQLVATVHGNTLDNLVANPTMSDLIGGVQAVTLSDEEARRRHTQKTVLERKAPPTFNVVVEMIERDKIAVRRPVADVVDGCLRGQVVPPQLRWRDGSGGVHIEEPAAPEPTPAGRHDFEMKGHPTIQRSPRRRGDWTPRESRSETGPSAALDEGGFVSPRRRSSMETFAEPTSSSADGATSMGAVAAAKVEDVGRQDSVVDAPDLSTMRRLFPLGVSRSRLSRAIKHLGLPLHPARTWKDADAVLLLGGGDGLVAHTPLLREARQMNLPIISVPENNYAQIAATLNELYNSHSSAAHLSARERALEEAREAAQRVMSQANPVELRPQVKTLRRAQHQLAQRYHLRSYSVGREPQRRVRILPTMAR